MAENAIAGIIQSIAVCITQTKARQRILAAIESAGLIARELRPQQLGRLNLLRDAAAVIYQPHSGRDEFIDDLIALRIKHPEVPILLYVRPDEYGGRILTYAGEHGVFRTEFDLNAPGEVERLRRTIEFTLGTRLVPKFQEALRGVLPNQPPEVEQFVRCCLAKLGGVLTSPPNVDRLARMMGMSVRTLEDHFSNATVPQPKEILDFVTWLWVAYWTDVHHARCSAVARKAGLGPKTLGRIRDRLAPGVPWRSMSPAAEFDVALQRLAARCDELKRAKEKRSEAEDSG